LVASGLVVVGCGRPDCDEEVSGRGEEAGDAAVDGSKVRAQGAKPAVVE